MSFGAKGMAEIKKEEARNSRALHRLLSYAAEEARIGRHTFCRRHILLALDALSEDLELQFGDDLPFDGKINRVSE